MEVPYQKYRDVFKILCAMEEKCGICFWEWRTSPMFIMQCRENMVYDLVEYAAQVQKSRGFIKARKEKDPKEKKPDSAEFLSGFYRRQAASKL